MADFLLLMHDDVPAGTAIADWGPYLARLQSAGVFRGGSRIGRGICVRRSGTAPPIASHLGGYLRIESDDFAQAERLLAGNPVFEAGGTIEIRELPRG